MDPEPDRSISGSVDEKAEMHTGVVTAVRKKPTGKTK